MGIVAISSCASLPFSPSREFVGRPSDINLAYESVRLTTSDNETITGWYVPGGPCAVLFLHGNAGNISHRLSSIEIFHQLGLSVFIIDYRGFGASLGSPSVSGTLLDAQAAWDWLRQVKGLSAEQIIIFGRSLGGAVACAQAAVVNPRALILESTFTSLYDVAKGMYPWLPVGLFLPQDYNTLSQLRNLRMPLLVAHSPDDEVVSYCLGRELYDSYAGPKQFLQLQGPHNTGFLQNRAQYVDGLREFLTSLDK